MLVVRAQERSKLWQYRCVDLALLGVGQPQQLAWYLHQGLALLHGLRRKHSQSTRARAREGLRLGTKQLGSIQHARDGRCRSAYVVLLLLLHRLLLLLLLLLLLILMMELLTRREYDEPYEQHER